MGEEEEVYTLTEIADLVLDHLRTELSERRIFPSITAVASFQQVLSTIEKAIGEKDKKFELSYMDRGPYIVEVLKKDAKKARQGIARTKRELQQLEWGYELERDFLLRQLEIIPWKCYLVDEKPLILYKELFLFPDAERQDSYHLGYFEQSSEGSLEFTISAEHLPPEEIFSEFGELIGKRRPDDALDKLPASMLEVQLPECTDLQTLAYLAVEKMKQP